MLLLYQILILFFFLLPINWQQQLIVIWDFELVIYISMFNMYLQSAWYSILVSVVKQDHFCWDYKHNTVVPKYDHNPNISLPVYCRNKKTNNSRWMYLFHSCFVLNHALTVMSVSLSAVDLFTAQCLVRLTNVWPEADASQTHARWDFNIQLLWKAKPLSQQNV